MAPWRDDAPAAGDPLFTFLSPRLTSPTLLQAIGGHAPGGTFFESGTWNRVSLQNRPLSRLGVELELLPRLRVVKDLLSPALARR